MAKKKTRNHYFETIDRIEINKQLNPSFLGVVLDGNLHLKNHSARKHGYDIYGRR